MLSDLKTITQELQPPVNRGKLLAIIGNGQLPPAVRGMVFLSIQSMAQSELDNLSMLAIQAITFVENNNLAGLHEFLTSHSIPAPIESLIMAYAKNIAKV